MKKLLLIVILFASSSALAADKTPDSAYGLTVEVMGSRRVVKDYTQYLYVLIDGTKYELSGRLGSRAALLKPGKYRARVVVDDHKTDFELSLTYEFLLPDNSRRVFEMIATGEFPVSP